MGGTRGLGAIARGRSDGTTSRAEERRLHTQCFSGFRRFQSELEEMEQHIYGTGYTRDWHGEGDSHATETLAAHLQEIVPSAPPRRSREFDIMTLLDEALQAPKHRSEASLAP